MAISWCADFRGCALLIPLKASREWFSVPVDWSNQPQNSGIPRFWQLAYTLCYWKMVVRWHSRLTWPCSGSGFVRFSKMSCTTFVNFFATTMALVCTKVCIQWRFCPFSRSSWGLYSLPTPHSQRQRGGPGFERRGPFRGCFVFSRVVLRVLLGWTVGGRNPIGKFDRVERQTSSVLFRLWQSMLSCNLGCSCG